MNRQQFISFIIIGLLLISSSAGAIPIADLIYSEQDLGGGLWQYDYTFFNKSTENENLFSVDLIFDQFANVNGGPLPSGWTSFVWEGSNYTDFIFTFSTNQGFDIAAGDSLSGFSFIIDYEADNIGYNAFFDDHQGRVSGISGDTAPVPEASTMILLGSGLTWLAGFRFLRRRNKT